MGYKFLENGLGEYIAVHDYQNVLDFEYYINIFQPECIIFDAADYTFSNQYFDLNTMQTISPPPLLSSFSKYSEETIAGEIEIQKKNSTTIITLNGINIDGDFAYLLDNGKEYDMKKIIDTDTGECTFVVTVNNNYYDGKNSKIIIVDTSTAVRYQVIY